MRHLPLALLLVLALPACGSRGEPLPPINKMPPPFPGAEIYQRGSDLVVAFDVLPAVVNVNSVMVTLEEVEILMQSELYPALTADLLAAALDEARRTRLRDARAAAAQAREEVRRIRDTVNEEVAETGDEAVADAEPEPEEEEEPELPGPTADELVLRSVPRAVLAEWRAASISPDAILATAYLLEEAVDRLWEDLGMPSAIVDLREPPALPDPGEIILSAARVQRTMSYTFAPDVFEFLQDAETLATIPFEELDSYRVGDRIEYPHPVPAPAPGNIRTRYAFGVRAISARGEDGAVGELLAAAPAPVPLPPDGLVVEIVSEDPEEFDEPKEGVYLLWQPPVADIRGAPIDPEDVRYNVYRRDLAVATVDRTPINVAPLAETEFLDTEIGWQERYIYEIRALSVTTEDRKREALEDDDDVAPVIAPADPSAPSTPERPESRSLASSEIFTEDTLAAEPVRGLTAVRTRFRVTLRWDESRATDLAGYRVYRHPAPVPLTPGIEIEGDLPLPPTDETGETTAELAATEGDATETEGVAAGGGGDEVEGQAEVEGVTAEQVGEREEETDVSQEEPLTPRARRQRRARNPLVEAGWELLTRVVVTQTRYIDPSADPAVTWVYLVEVVDEADNVSTPVAVTLEPDDPQ